MSGLAVFRGPAGGGPAEAAGWMTLATTLRLDPVDQWEDALADLQNSLADLNKEPPPDLAARIGEGIRDFPLPEWDGEDRPVSSGEPLAAQSSLPHAPFRLTNEATSRGIDFQFDNPAVPGMWLHQSNGGGVAATDFDCDGWPDLYFGNAGGEPLDDDGSRPNRLYRNLAGRFADVTQNAGVGGTAFSQGICAGDYDDDGFPDLLIANIGRNQLLRHNGDGTFTDVIQEAGLGDARWTTSMAIADIGATVRVHSGKKILTAQVTAGGGYHCSNERRLLFGLGESEEIERLEVEWSDDSTQQFEQLPANQHLLVIEGRAEPVVMGTPVH